MITPRQKTAFASKDVASTFANGFIQTGLVFPNGSLDADVIEDLITRITGTLTTSGGTTDGVPTVNNPRMYNQRVTCKVVNLPIPDPLDIMGEDLDVLNQCMMRNMESDPDDVPVPSGAVNAYNWEYTQRIPFGCLDMQGGDDYFLNIPALINAGASAVQFGLALGGPEHFVSKYDATNAAVGDRVAALSSVLCKWDRTVYTTNPNYASLVGKMLLCRQSMAPTQLPTGGNAKNEIQLLKNPAYLRRLGFKLYKLNTDNTEVPADDIFTRDMDFRLLLGSVDTPIEITAGFIKAEHLRRYRRPLPVGHYVLDLCPNGDPDVLRQWNLAALPQIKFQFGSVAGTNYYVRPYFEEHIPLA